MLRVPLHGRRRLGVFPQLDAGGVLAPREHLVAERRALLGFALAVVIPGAGKIGLAVMADFGVRICARGWLAGSVISRPRWAQKRLGPWAGISG